MYVIVLGSLKFQLSVASSSFWYLEAEMSLEGVKLGLWVGDLELIFPSVWTDRPDHIFLNQFLLDPALQCFCD